MIYSSRLKKILLYCLNHQDSYVSLDDLAQLLKISKRTIFREIKNIDQDLAAYELRLVSHSGKGILLEGSKEKKEELFRDLQMEGVDYVNKEERRGLLMFELLRSSSIHKLLHYANMFQVSEATISNDLDSMTEWFQNYHLELIRKPGLGVEVCGEERDMRFAMTQLLHQTLQNNSSYEKVNYLDSQTLLHEIFMNDEHNSIMRLLNQEILERILHVFQCYQHELSLDRYAQVSYIGLIIHLVIAVERILKKEEIANNTQVLAMIHDDVSFLQAEKMAQYLELEFDIDIPETEIAFIALHIKGAKITSMDHAVKDENATKIYELIHTLIMSYEEDIRRQLLQDEELIHGLSTHLEPTIIRLKNQLPIYNPLLSQIKEMYHDIFEQTKEACRCMEKAYNCHVSEDEVGFITMHIQASLEREKQQKTQMREVSIKVVCASGIGVSALLCARIAKAFPYGVHVKTLSMDALLRKEYQDCELLVSTFPLDVDDVCVLQVSALLTSEDIVQMKQCIEELRKKETTVLKEFEGEFHNQLALIKNCCESIEDILQHVRLSVVDDQITIEELFSFIADEYGETREEKQELEEALWRRERMGSIILPQEGFAMFHTRCSTVKHGIFHLYYPKGEHFAKEEWKALRFMVVLLADTQSPPCMQQLLSSISRALIEQNTFHQAICTREEVCIRRKLEEILKAAFIEILEDVL